MRDGLPNFFHKLKTEKEVRVAYIGGSITKAEGWRVRSSEWLKEQNPEIQIIAVEPPLGERVEGLRNIGEGYIPPVFENWNGFDILDRKRVVRPRESIEWTRRLVHECGIFSGISAGAALAGADDGRGRGTTLQRLRYQLPLPGHEFRRGRCLQHLPRFRGLPGHRERLFRTHVRPRKRPGRGRGDRGAVLQGVQ